MKVPRNILAIEKIVWSRSPLSAAITFFHALLAGLLPAILSAQIQRIIQIVQGGQSWRALLVAISILAGVYLLDSLFQAAYSVANNAGVFERVNLSLRADFSLTACEFPAIRFEEVDFLNKLQSLREAIDNEELPMFHYSLMNHFQALICLISLTALLYSYNPFLSLLALLSTAPVLINRWIRGSAFNSVREKLAPESRKAERIKSWFYQEPHAKEVRVNDAYAKLEKKWSESYERKARVESDFLLTDYRQFELCQLLKVIGLLAAIVLAVFFARSGHIPLSMAAAAILAFSHLQMAAVDFFRTLGNGKYYLSRSIAILEIMQSLKRQKPQAASPQSSGDFLLQGLSFRYPGADRNALQDINLLIKKGERIGIVGRNGSGKTSLAKLLMGLYPPTEGELSLPELRHLAYVPQEVPKFKLSLREYLSLGLATEPRDSELLQSLRDLGLNWGEAELSQQIGRDFGGLEFSGGEWQRLAIARTALQEPDLLVYDEATRAIDPLNESFVLEKILELSQRSTSLIITHRLAICPSLDKILLLHEGRLEAFAPHAELLESSPRYREMYESQSAAYR